MLDFDAKDVWTPDMRLRLGTYGVRCPMDILVPSKQYKIPRHIADEAIKQYLVHTRGHSVPVPLTGLLPEQNGEVTKVYNEGQHDIHTDITQSTRRYHVLPVGCPSIDRILGGGLLAGGITEIAGESSAGKTQFCLQLLLQVQLPPHLGGISSKALYIHTEGDSRIVLKRIQSLSQAYHERYGSDIAHINFGDNIYIEHVSTLEEQVHCVEKRLPHIMKRDSNVKLVILDSMASLVRERYAKDETRERASFLCQQAGVLKYVADTYRCVVAVVNQATAVFNGTGHSAGGETFKPALGMVWGHCVNTRVILSRSPYSLQRQGHGGCTRVWRALQGHGAGSDEAGGNGSHSSNETKDTTVYTKQGYTMSGYRTITPQSKNNNNNNSSNGAMSGDEPTLLTSATDLMLQTPSHDANSTQKEGKGDSSSSSSNSNSSGGGKGGSRSQVGDTQCIRVLRVAFSPVLPPRSCEYIITPQGLAPVPGNV